MLLPRIGIKKFFSRCRSISEEHKLRCTKTIGHLSVHESRPIRRDDREGKFVWIYGEREKWMWLG